MILIREKKLIESKYKFLKCSIKGGKLVCLGKVQPTKHSIEYTIKIIYDGLNNPKAFVTKPEIKYHDDIHMFPSDNSLCLYHSETDNFVWNATKHNVYNTIVPWALEWLIYYELYLISGKWEHPFVPHNTPIYDTKPSNKITEMDSIIEEVPNDQKEI